MLIVTWNASGTLPMCLEALHRSTVDLDVICVDNASTDGSADLAAAHGATVLRSDVNEGFPAAVNRGLPLCTAPLVLLLNPDTEVEPDTISRCRDVLVSDPAIGVVGANLRQPDGRPDRAAARRFRTLGHLILESTGLPRVRPSLDRQYLPDAERQCDRDVDCVNGAFMLLRAAELHELGGLDESAFLFLEDQDLCWRLRQRGRRVRFVAGARAKHVGSAAITASSPVQQAVVFLHRIDSSIELIARMQGRLAREVAIAAWCLRCAAGLVVSLARPAGRLRYSRAIRWLVRQPRGRRPPPRVPTT